MQTRYSVFIALIFCMALAPAVYAAPQAVIDKPEYNAGDVPQGKQIKGRFIIKNTGDEPLTIQARSCCGYTVAAPSAPIEPGGQATLTVSIATIKLRGTKYRKGIEIQTNAPGTPSMSLTVRANILENLTVTPTFVNFGQVRQGSNYVREIEVANNGTAPLIITQITAQPSDTLTVSPLQKMTLKPGAKNRVMLTLTPGKKTGLIEGSVTIKSDLERLPDKMLPVRAEVIVP